MKKIYPFIYLVFLVTVFVLFKPIIGFSDFLVLENKLYFLLIVSSSLFAAVLVYLYFDSIKKFEKKDKTIYSLVLYIMIGIGILTSFIIF